MKNRFQLLLCMLLAVVTPSVASAELLHNPAPHYGTMYDFIMALLEIVLLIGLPMVAIAIIYAGFLLATAGGDEKKAESGKMVIVWAIVGGMIILGAKVIAELIRGTWSLF